MSEDAYLRKRFDEASRLLYAAAHHMADDQSGPSCSWWHDFFLFDGSHMIRTDDGWMSGTEKADCIENDIPILDEVNVPLT